MADRQAIEREILELLPADGSPVLNRVMMALIGRRLGEPVDTETYFTAVDTLSASDFVGRQRGQGGKIYRLQPIVREPSDASMAWPEPKLMPSLGKFLKTVFYRSLDLSAGALWQVIDTSMHGPQEKWGRPDFTVVSVVPLKVVPQPQLDVYSFELKAEPKADVTSVQQALAQTRMTHFGYLVWHLPEGSQYETRLGAVSEQCRRHGIGLILIRDPEALETWSVEIDAQRQPTAVSDVDGFLAARLSDHDCRAIRQKLMGG